MKELLTRLESAVSQLISKNRELESNLAELQEKFFVVQAQRDSLENTLQREHKDLDSLSKEKDSIKIAIESLLENIKTLEGARE